MSQEESLDNFRARLNGSVISTYVVILLLVPLKLWCRVRAGGWGNLGWDDALSVVALMFASAFTLVALIGMREALGVHIVDLELDQIINFLTCVFVDQLMYSFAISMSKFSILAFYWRLFSVTARVPIYVMTFIVFGWLMSMIFTVTFACAPVQASWDLTITDKKCLSLKSIYLGGSLPNAITDVMLILMPLPYVWRLHAPVSQRLLLAGLFLLGIFIAVVSVVRLFIFLRIPIDSANDVTFHFREIIIWSCVEINVGLACACLPSLKPALGFLGLDKLFSFNSSLSASGPSPGPSKDLASWNTNSGGSSKRPRKKGATGGLFSTIAGMSRLDDEEDAYQLTDSRVHGKSTAEVQLARVSHDTDNESKNSRSQIQNGISVQQDWSVVVDQRDSKGR